MAHTVKDTAKGFMDERRAYSDAAVEVLLVAAIEQERKRCLDLIQEIMLNNDFRSGVDACSRIWKAIEKGEHGKT